jgi:hypothetical protein
MIPNDNNLRRSPAMSSSTRDEVLRHLQAVVEIEPPVQQTGKAIYASDLTHEMFRAYTRSPHDVGGQVDVPVEWTEEESEAWGYRAYVTTECLAWRGVWCAEERRRMQNVDPWHQPVPGLALLRPLAAFRGPDPGGGTSHHPYRTHQQNRRGEKAP